MQFYTHNDIKKLLVKYPVTSRGKYFLILNNFCLCACLMVFNATFNNISAISWRLVLLVEEIGGPGENHLPVAELQSFRTITISYPVLLNRVRRSPVESGGLILVYMYIKWCIPVVLFFFFFYIFLIISNKINTK